MFCINPLNLDVTWSHMGMKVMIFQGDVLSTGAHFGCIGQLDATFVIFENSWMGDSFAKREFCKSA
jgi:hypothetical protein